MGKLQLENKKFQTLNQEKQLRQQESLQSYKQAQQKQQQSQQLSKQEQQLKQQESLQIYKQAQQKQLQDQQQMQQRLSSSQIYNTDKQYDKVFTKVEHPAEFPGGDEAWKRYLERNLNTKVAAPKGVYTVHVQFIVNEDGSLHNVSAEVPKDCRVCGQEAINLIKKGPKWEPAVQNGRNVVYQTIKDVTFTVD